jgi:hypothetical protein
MSSFVDSSTSKASQDCPKISRIQLIQHSDSKLLVLQEAPPIHHPRIGIPVRNNRYCSTGDEILQLPSDAEITEICKPSGVHDSGYLTRADMPYILLEKPQ